MSNSCTTGRLTWPFDSRLPTGVRFGDGDGKGFPVLFAVRNAAKEAPINMFCPHRVIALRNASA